MGDMAKMMKARAKDMQGQRWRSSVKKRRTLRPSLSTGEIRSRVGQAPAHC